MNYIDRRKFIRGESSRNTTKTRRKKIVVIYSPKLPDTSYDSRIITREWILKHRIMWIQMKNLKNCHDNLLYNEFNKENLNNNEEIDKKMNDEIKSSKLILNNERFGKLKNMLKYPFKKLSIKFRNKQKVIRKSVFYKHLEENAQLIDYSNTIRHNSDQIKRRNHSWPKCNKDFSEYLI